VKDAGAGAEAQQGWGSALWFELRMVLLLALPTVITSAAQQVIIITSQVRCVGFLWVPVCQRAAF
jgi:hypothetical protein